MNFDLTAWTRRAKNPRRSTIEIRPIQPTATMAGDLYAAAYKPVITAWATLTERLLATYTASTPTSDALTRDSASDIQNALNAAEMWLDRLILTITPALREWAVKAERWHCGKWTAAVLNATGIDLTTVLSAYDTADTVDAFVARNVALVKSVDEQTRHRIADIVYRNYAARVPPRQVAKEMSEAVGLSRSRALRIAADQNSKLAGRLDQVRQEEAGISRFRYRSSHKRHPREWHAARDGKVYDWRTRKQIDGSDVIDPLDMPRQPPFCGCTTQAVMSFE